MPNQPLPRIVGVMVKPLTCRAEAKAITPAIHILHYSLAPERLDAICKQNLQVANSGFFIVVATGIAIQTGAAFIGHANDVAGFVQQ